MKLWVSAPVFGLFFGKKRCNVRCKFLGLWALCIVEVTCDSCELPVVSSNLMEESFF